MVTIKYISLALFIFIFQHVKSSENTDLLLTYTENKFGSMVPESIAPQLEDFDYESEMISSSSSKFKKAKIVQEEDFFLPSSFSDIDVCDFNMGRLPVTEIEMDPLGLSIDGGGIRGIMPALLLEELSDQLKEDHRVQVQDIFDVFGGTSVGGLIALGLANGKTPSDLVSIFRDHKEIIFSKTKLPFIPKKINNLINTSRNLLFVRYSNDNLKRFLREDDFFGERLLSDLNKDVLVTACGTDGFPHILKSQSFGEQDLSYMKSNQLPIWQAALATSAAPTFFPSIRVDFEGVGEKDLVDGGIWCNNPSFLVATHLMKKFNAPTHQVNILSLGTGRIINDNWLSRSAGPITMAGPLIDVLMRSHSTGNHQTMSTLFGEKYTRINPRLYEPIELDSTSDESIEILTKAASDEKNNISKFLESYSALIKTKLERLNYV